MQLQWHQQRMESSQLSTFGYYKNIDLKEVIKIPAWAGVGLIKCRILYKRDVDSMEFLAYEKKPINSLKLIEANDIQYPFKYANRNALNRLFQQKGEADDVLIVKNGLITDGSYTNVAFYDGINWLTPAIPLLDGTTRQRLIQEKILLPDFIPASQVHLFEKIRMFNAMTAWTNAYELDTEQISNF